MTETAPSPLKIVLVDDHPLFLRGLAGLMRGQPDFLVQAELHSGTEAIAECQRCCPDLVLLDVRMPKPDGLATLQRLLEDTPELAVVMLTASEDDELVARALRQGARGFLLKTLEPTALFDRLREVARGEAALPWPMTADLLRRLTQNPVDSERDAVSRLSERERQILISLADGLTNKEIGARLFIAENTVKNHVKRVLQKLGVDNRTQAAGVALRKGLA